MLEILASSIGVQLVGARKTSSEKIDSRVTKLVKIDQSEGIPDPEGRFVKSAHKCFFHFLSQRFSTIFALAVFRSEPQLTERPEEAIEIYA